MEEEEVSQSTFTQYKTYDDINRTKKLRVRFQRTS